MQNGIVVVKKEDGITSQGVVNRIKRLFGEKKAGHTGTLDPLATGVLPVLIGRAVKASEYMLTADKYYTAELTLGITSDTEDITGEILSQTDLIPTEREVLSVISSFEGKIMQIPPMYSALKVGGKKLCDLARAGEVIERAPREITVYSIDAERISDTRYTLNVHCSKGTYIRTLCADIGKALGCGAVMSALTRTRASVFTLDEAITLSEIENMSEEERTGLVIPVERVFADRAAVTLPAFFARLAKNGLPIYLKKIGLSLDTGTQVRLLDNEGFFALGEVVEDPDGLAIKPIKQF